MRPLLGLADLPHEVESAIAARRAPTTSRYFACSSSPVIDAKRPSCAVRSPRVRASPSSSSGASVSCRASSALATGSSARSSAARRLLASASSNAADEELAVRAACPLVRHPRNRAQLRQAHSLD